MNLGTLFDISQLLISLVDAFSDAAVAYEFYEKNQMIFFYIIGFLFVCGSIVDSFLFVVQTSPNGSIEEKDWYIWMTKTIVLAPFGPFLPSLNYCIEEFNLFDWRQSEATKVRQDYARRQREISEINNNNNSNSSSSASSGNNNYMDRIDSAISLRQATMQMINIQSVVETIPQCVVQLVALSVNPDTDATPLQLFSLFLSLISIAVKLFQLARSYTMKVFVAKFLFLVHDLFALAFISSSVFSSSIPSEYRSRSIEFSSSFPYTPSDWNPEINVDNILRKNIVHVTPLSYYWIYVEFTTIKILFTVAATWFALLLYNDKYTKFWVKMLIIFVYSVATFCLLLPFTFVHQALSLSSLVLIDMFLSPFDLTNSRKLSDLKDFLFMKNEKSNNGNNNNNNGNNKNTKMKLKLPVSWKQMFMNCRLFYDREDEKCKRETDALKRQHTYSRVGSLLQRINVVNYFFDFCCTNLPSLVSNETSSSSSSLVEPDTPIRRIQHTLLISYLDEQVSKFVPRMAAASTADQNDPEDKKFDVRHEQDATNNYRELINILSDEIPDDSILVKENNKKSAEDYKKIRDSVRNSLPGFLFFVFRGRIVEPILCGTKRFLKRTRDEFMSLTWLEVVGLGVTFFKTTLGLNNRDSRLHDRDSPELANAVAGALLLLTTIPMIFFSLFFPFIHFLFYAPHYNVVMMVTFALTQLPFLFSLLFLMGDYIEYEITNLVYSEITTYNTKTPVDSHPYFSVVKNKNQSSASSQPDDMVRRTRQGVQAALNDIDPSEYLENDDESRKRKFDRLNKWQFLMLAERSYFSAPPVAKILSKFCFEDDSTKIPSRAVENHVGVFLTSCEIGLVVDDEFEQQNAEDKKKKIQKERNGKPQFYDDIVATFIKME
jgi:hypothetical protein